MPPQPLLQEPSQVPLHEVLQSPVQFPLHVPLQVSAHEPEHPLQNVDASALSGNVDKTTTPTTGNAAFAAFLKNSLRDWSSSFDFFCFITTQILIVK